MNRRVVRVRIDRLNVPASGPAAARAYAEALAKALGQTLARDGASLAPGARGTTDLGQAAAPEAAAALAQHIRKGSSS